MREQSFEAKVKKLIEARSGLCLKWVSPGRSGVPDRICIFPGGRIVFLETKAPKTGKLSLQQINMHRRLKARGCDVYVVDHIDQVKEILDDL